MAATMSLDASFTGFAFDGNCDFLEMTGIGTAHLADELWVTNIGFSTSGSKF